VCLHICRTPNPCLPTQAILITDYSSVGSRLWYFSDFSPHPSLDLLDSLPQETTMTSPVLDRPASHSVSTHRAKPLRMTPPLALNYKICIDKSTFCSSGLISMVRPKPAVRVDTRSAPRTMHPIACRSPPQPGVPLRLSASGWRPGPSLGACAGDGQEIAHVVSVGGATRTQSQASTASSKLTTLCSAGILPLQPEATHSASDTR
jgi:hypothetical protein